MKLKKLSIKNYKSIKQEVTLFVDDRVTILIGANDHGKSNLLSAIQCLNDDRQIGSEDINWDSSEQSPAEIKWHFTPNQEVEEKLKIFSAPQEPSFPLESEIPTFPISSDGEVIFSRDSNDNKLKVVALPLPVPITNEGGILALRPRIELFESPSGNVIDQINRAQLDDPQYEFMQGIFRLANIWDERDKIFNQTNKTSKKLKDASLRLTQILNDKWKQGKDLNWIFEHTGTNGDHIAIKIEDSAIKGSHSRPSLRSSGFKTYFLLTMMIYARTQNAAPFTKIYLFDEPGTYLHPAAQLDLQRSFELIADRAQIAYTTHSLFLISKNHPSRNRVISKTEAGTKVDQRPFNKNWKSVRDSLGILLSNNFLIADKTLLVEGPTDVIYCLDALRKLKAQGKIDIDLNDISFVDAGDSRDYVTMAKLLLAEGRDIVALLDGDKGGSNINNALKKACSAEIEKNKLQIHILPENKSSEDIFANHGLLRKATKIAFEKLTKEGHKIPKDDINIDQEINKIKETSGITLGKVLDEVTESLFIDKEDKISKLLIATLYEDEGKITDPQDSKSAYPVPSEAASELLKIKDLLKLRGEKSAEAGVYTEV